jgi:uracil-DNA glycosylase
MIECETVDAVTEPDDGRRAAALAQLHRAVAACHRCVDARFIETACPIFKGEVGNRVMVVGQAPGALACERPLPYSGATGRTLRAWLARAGFPPEALHERFYLTSLTKCFPGPSTGGKGDRAPSAAEISLCRDHLDGELALVRPAVVLALGRPAATALCRDRATAGRAPTLTELVGTVREVERAGYRFRLLPLPHPSGVSRWLNEASNRERHARALALLAALRVELAL